MLKPTATIELVLMDETGSTSAVVLNVSSTTSTSVMDAQATALASLIAPLTDCVLIKIRYCYRAITGADISDAGSTPLATAGIIFLATTSEDHIGLVNIPAIKPSLFLTTGNGAGVLMDTSSSDLIALVEELVALNVSTPTGDVLDHLLTAYRQSRV